MTVERAQRRLTGLQLASVVAGAGLVALVITLAAPFRVADCGPADPSLLRYLGGPFLHRTGTGIPASMESRIWAGPFFANIAVIAALGISLQLISPRVPSRPLVLWACIVVALTMTLILLSIAINVDDMLWTLSGPPITAEACDIRFEFSPDRQAWQAAP